MTRLFRITTVPVSMFLLLRNQLRFMSQHYDVTGICSNGELLKSIGEQEGIRMMPVNMTRKITPLKDIIGLWKLYRLMKREKPLIVHTHSPKAGLLGMMAARMARVPVRLHTVAGLPLLEIRGLKRTLLDVVETLTYSCCTMVYPNSNKMKEIILHNGYCTEDKLKVIGNGSSNGIDTRYFDPSQYAVAWKVNMRNTLRIGEKDIVFCFVGRIVKPKGIVELLNAFTKLAAGNNRVKLIMVGPFDSDKDQLGSDTIAQIKHHPQISWVGFKMDIRPYLSISDVFVFPSYREGFPNVVMQACAMQLPCIVTDINGNNELITDGMNGLIVPVKNEEALMQAMLQLSIDERLRHSMAQNSRDSIVRNFDQQYVFNCLLKEYALNSEQVTEDEDLKLKTYNL